MGGRTTANARTDAGVEASRIFFGRCPEASDRVSGVVFFSFPKRVIIAQPGGDYKHWELHAIAGSACNTEWRRHTDESAQRVLLLVAVFAKHQSLD